MGLPTTRRQKDYEMRRTLAGFSLVLFLIAAPAQGDLTLEALRDPIEGSSWLQNFHLIGPDSFKGLGIILTSNEELSPSIDRFYEGFEARPALDFSEAWATEGWREDLFLLGPEFGHNARAAGVPTNELLWRSHFRDDPDTRAFTMTLFAYDLISDLFPTGSTAAFWSGTEWRFDTTPGVTWEEYQMMTTPAPNAALLAAMGLGLVGFIKRRFA